MADAGEFDLIRRYFQPLCPPMPGLDLGIGDDAALWRPSADKQWVICADTLVAGSHFLPDQRAEDVGHKALAVNLSDMAAMGGSPRAALLCLTLPHSNAAWLQGFAQGFGQLAQAFGLSLIGGDTTRGPLSISITLFGERQPALNMRRGDARPGDAILITGCTGLAALGLQLQQGQLDLAEPHHGVLLQHLHRPQPQVTTALAVAEHLHAAIDVSDGLLADLGHILDASACGAELWLDALPDCAALQAARQAGVDTQAAQLSGGEDYVLCLSCPQEVKHKVLRLCQQHAADDSREIGRMTESRQRLLRTGAGQYQAWPERTGYQHF